MPQRQPLPRRARRPSFHPSCPALMGTVAACAVLLAPPSCPPSPARRAQRAAPAEPFASAASTLSASSASLSQASNCSVVAASICARSCPVAAGGGRAARAARGGPGGESPRARKRLGGFRKRLMGGCRHCRMWPCAPVQVRGHASGIHRDQVVQVDCRPEP